MANKSSDVAKKMPVVEKSDRQISDSFPWRVMGVLYLALLVHAIAYTSVFPFVAFMVVDLGLVDSINEAGTYAGFIAGAMMTGRMFGSALWGVVADKWGRKPVLVISVSSIFSTSILFGFANSFEVAVFARFLMGFGNAIVATSKTVIPELVPKTHRARAMASTSGIWYIGMTFGLVLGGLLARPALQYPKIFCGGQEQCSTVTPQAGGDGDALPFWAQHPYLLPMIPIALAALVCILLFLFAFPETLPPESVSKEAEPLAAKCSNDDEDIEAQLIDRGEDVHGRTAPFRCCRPFCKAHPGLPSACKLFAIPDVVLAMCNYGSILLVSVAYSDVIGLWTAATPDAGGLGWTTDITGTFLAIVGGCSAVWSFILYPMTLAKWSLHSQLRFGRLALVPTLLCFPFVSSLQQREGGVGDWRLWVPLVMIGVAVQAWFNVCFTAASVMSNNSVSARQRGMMNGVVSMIGSVAGAVAPIAASKLFAWSVLPDVALPFLTHWILAALCLVSLAFFSYTLPAHLSEGPPA